MDPEKPMPAGNPHPLRADPAELSRLASATLDLATTLASDWRATAHLLVPGPANLGDGVAVNGGERLRRSTEAVAAAADLALRRVGDVLAGDADRLWRTAFAYEEADERARWRMGRGRRW